MAYQKFSEEERKKYREKQIEDAANRMNQYINDMKDTDKFKEFLKTTSKFHNYSMRNIVLIAQQKPEATLVAGYNSWKNNFERHVQKGAKGIKILAPIIKKMDHEKLDSEGKIVRDEQGKPIKESRPTIVGYKTQNVFDISDTKGKKLTTARDLIHDSLSNSNDYENVYREFKDTLNKNYDLNVYEASPLDNKILYDGANGYYVPSQREIVISDAESYDMRFRTLIHEFAHYKLHTDNSKNLDTETKELQAESCAYIVADYFNLDTSDYSVGYAATWTGKEKDTLINYLTEIKEFASETIEEINSMPQFEQYITQKQTQELSQEEENNLNEMIERNLKNGFDKVSIIQSNLKNDFGMNEKENIFENKNFKVHINYDGFSTRNLVDKCSIEVINKTSELKTNHDYKQTYNLNKLNNTSQLIVEDRNDSSNKKYIHERDLEGNIKSNDFKELSNEDQLLFFDKYIDNNITSHGIAGTQTKLLSDAYKMGYKLVDSNDNDSSDIKLTLLKNENKNLDNPFHKEDKIEISILNDSNKNHYAYFKMENSKGTISKMAKEGAQEFKEKAHDFMEDLKQKKEQIEI